MGIRHQRPLVLLTVCIMATALLLTVGAAVGKTKRLERYGETPGLAVTWDDGGKGCQVITIVDPPAHYNVFGQAWQDDYLLWTDLRLEGGYAGSITPFAHGRTGPVKVGQQVCNLNENVPWLWIYGPSDRVVHAVDRR